MLLRARRRVRRRISATSQRRADERDRRLDVSRHERRIDPDDAVTRASKHRVTARIGASLLGVVPAIDFDREPLCRR